jgi:hypothetical protein
MNHKRNMNRLKILFLSALFGVNMSVTAQTSTNEQVQSFSLKEAIDYALMENLNEIFERLNPRMIFDMQRYFPEVWQIFKEHKNGYMFNKIIANLNRGKREGLFRKDIHEEISARMRLEQIQTSMDLEVFPPDKFTIKEITCSY